MNKKPRIFVVSAAESVDVMQRLLRQSHSRLRYVPWSRLGVFEPGTYNIPTLLSEMAGADGAAVLAVGLDTVRARGTEQISARDNVLLELGMALGIFGLEGTALISDQSVHLPSDLLGLSPISYEATSDPDQDAAELHARLEHFFRNAEPSGTRHAEQWPPRPVSIVFHTHENPERGEFEEIVNMNALRSITELVRKLSEFGVRVDLISSRSNTFPTESDLILVGSAASNRLTADVMERVSGGLRYTLTFDRETMREREVADAIGETRLAPTFNGRGELTRDYGLVTRVRSPWHRERWVITVEGNYGVGTAAATAALVSGEVFQSEGVTPTSQFQTLIGVNAMGGFMVGSPEILDVHVCR
jgi:hypothetical protein